MHLIAYLRVSTDEQAREGRSLEIQEQQIRKWCDLYGHALVDVIADEGVSAGTELGKRPGGAALLEALKDGQAQGFVVHRLDRAFRLTLDGLTTATWFRQRDLTINSVTDMVDSSTAMGWWMLTVMLANAQLERDRTRERNRDVSAGLREQGRAWGPTPFGCVNVDGYLYRDPATWAVREEIVALYDGGDGHSLREIARRLHAEHIPAPGGGSNWHAQTVRGVVTGHHDLEHIPPLSSAPETRVSIAG